MMEKSFVETIISDNLNRIQNGMNDACIASGRKLSSVKLLAVTKTVDIDRINTAIRLGIKQIGENRVQEYLQKQDKLLLNGVEAHLIGHLQTNKVKQIVGKVQMIQSVDSIRLANEISKRSEEVGIITPVLVEVNIGDEDSKSGVSPSELERLIYHMASLPGVSVQGLMTVPPILQKECEKRAIFAKMYQLFVDIKAKNIDNISMQELSMGMSNDYREAIMEGSTMVRVGSALFGERQY